MAFNPDRFLAGCCIGSGQSNFAVELTVGYCAWGAVAPAKVLVRVQRKLTAENVTVKSERSSRSRRNDIGLQDRHALTL